MNKIRVITSLFLLLAVCEVMGTTYYVSPFGSDTNNGQSPSTAFKTFSRASTALYNKDTLWVLPGLYSGSENSYITLDHTSCTIVSTEGPGQTIVVGPGQWSIRDSVTIEGIQFTNFQGSNPVFDVYNFGTYTRSYLSFTLQNITAYNNNQVIAIENEDNIISIYNSNFTSNTMVVSHPQSDGYNGKVIVVNSTFTKGAGGITGFYDSVSISNSTFSSLRCAYQGCAVSLNKTDNLLINETLFIDNISSTNGGAIWLSSLSEGSVITNSVFTQNTAVNGGAIYTLDSLEISDSKFESNYASSVGGALYIKGTASSSTGATIAETDFEKNTGATSAGAVYCENSVVSYQYVDFTENYAPIGSSYQCGTGCSTYLFNVNSNGNSPSCSSSTY